MSATSRETSQAILRRNRQYIPGGTVSLNRLMDPPIVFAKGEGAHVWDVEGQRYIDYHAAFSPYFLGHNDPSVNKAVIGALHGHASLFGAGTTELEGRLAELICTHIPWVESVQFLNSGSEATSQAIRLARAATARDHIIVMQGGYNGWHNDVACNLMTPLEELGQRRTSDEYPFVPISAGIPHGHRTLVHAVNFNDLDSVRAVAERYPIAALITEPVLQNIGVVPPFEGYLKGLRTLADQYGFVLIFDEVKTGFRHAFGGYAQLAGVRPDLVVYGKALANGYPISALGGTAGLMQYFVDADLRKRVLLAGTCNGHPVPTVAAIATLERLLMNSGAVYADVERLGVMLENGLNDICRSLDVPATLVRVGSAFCLYFMDHVPRDWHDVASNHQFQLDVNLRRELVRRGVFFFPMAVKQCSISAAHSEDDIAVTLDHLREVLPGVVGGRPDQRPSEGAR